MSSFSLDMSDRYPIDTPNDGCPKLPADGYLPYFKHHTPNWCLIRFGPVRLLLVKPNERAYGRYLLDFATSYQVARIERAAVYFFPPSDQASEARINLVINQLLCEGIQRLPNGPFIDKVMSWLWRVYVPVARKIVDWRINDPPRTYRRRLLYERLPMSLPKDLEARAELLLAKLGVPREKPIVTLHLRDSTLDMLNQAGTDRRRLMGRRTVIPEDYFLALDYLHEKGFAIVRLGSPKMTRIRYPSLIDLTLTGDDRGLLEVYSLFRSTFFICTDAGPELLPVLAGVPKLVTNATHWAFLYPLREADVCLLKRIFDKEKNKFLDSSELFSLEFNEHCLNLDRYGYVMNSDTDILGAVKEMEGVLETGRPMSPSQKSFLSNAQDIASRYEQGKGITRGGARRFFKWGADQGFLGKGRIAQVFLDHNEESYPNFMAGKVVSYKERKRKTEVRSFADQIDAEITEAISKRKTTFGFLRPRDFEYIKERLRSEVARISVLVGANLFQSVLMGMQAIALLAFVQLLLGDEAGKKTTELSVLGLTIPLPFQSVAATKNGGLVVVFGILIALMLGSAGLTFFRNHLSVVLQNRLTFYMTKDLITKLLKLDISYFSETKLGEIQFLQNQVVSRVSGIVSATQNIIISSLNLSMVMAILIKLSASLTLITGMGGLIIFAVSSRFSRYVNTLSQNHGQRERKKASVFFEMLHGIGLIKQGAQEEIIKESYLNRVWDVCESSRKMSDYQQFVRGTTEVGGTMMLILAVTVFSFLSDLNLFGNLGFTVGYFFIALQALMLVKQLTEARMRQAASIPRVTFLTRFLDLEEHGLEQAQFSGAMSFKGVSRGLKVDRVNFAYKPDNPVLKGFSANFPYGKITGLVGLSGSGKTTLLELLAGFRFPNDGRVLIDGAPMTDFDIRSFRKEVGYLTQDTILFHDSIRNNIRYFRPDVTEEEMEEAIRLAGVSEFINKMDQGLDTIVGEHGASISGGQRQRIALARALIQRPSLLLLDEATSAMDLQTESEIHLNLQSIKKDKVIVVSTHRLSAIRDIDNIIVLNDGRVVEQGRHEELMAQDGLYRHLYMVQERRHSMEL
jgi:putative glycosyltransferase (TIGR04372 family)